LQSLLIGYSYQHNTKEMKKTAEALLAINPKNGLALDTQRSFSEPAQTVQANSAAAIASFEKAEAAFARADWAGALKLYDQALAADPRFVKAHIYKGDALLQMGEIDKAIECYRKALTIDARDKQAHRFLGDTLHRKYLQNGDRKLLTEAIEHFETALKIDPNYAMARDSLSAAKAELGVR
jgi:tetratricopeptide (TPR) repeat protein